MYCELQEEIIVYYWPYDATSFHNKSHAACLDFQSGMAVTMMLASKARERIAEGKQ